MKKAPVTKWPRQEAAFRAKALRLASESHSTLAAVRALNIDPQRRYALYNCTAFCREVARKRNGVTNYA